MKTITAPLALVFGLSACGGGSAFLNYSFGGTVSGVNCFSSFQQTQSVVFAVKVGEFAAGSPVTLVDQTGNTWAGVMTSSSSFRVTNAAENADPRTSIVASNFTPEGAHIDVTTSCVSFRCCTTLSGDVRV